MSSRRDRNHGLLEEAPPRQREAVRGALLKGIEFSIREETLVGRLEANGVQGAVVSQVRKQLPEGEYRGPKDVIDALRRQ